MFPGYHYSFREHGRRNVQRTPALPDAALGIGAAENLNPQMQNVFFGPVPRVPRLQEARNQEGFNAGEGKFIKPEDFPTEGFKGLAIYSF